MGTFVFNQEKFNQLFPFYILMDANLNIISSGDSINKLVPIKTNESFLKYFTLKRPQVLNPNYRSFLGLQNELLIFQLNSPAQLSFRGQLQAHENNTLLFIGSPWFNSMNAVKENNLTIKDFPIHDAVIDLLHVIKTQEITNSDIKDLLTKVNEQTKVLKNSESQLVDISNRLALIISNLQNAVLLEDENRNILLVNNAFCQFFNIPATPQQLLGSNCENSAEQSKHLFKQPQEFIEIIQDLLLKRQKRLGDILELIDGRILSRDYIPIFVDDEYKGHLWMYADITSEKQHENDLNKQKDFYEQILNRMPADIAVFDKNHRYLYANPVAFKDEKVRQWVIGKTDFEYCAYRNRNPQIAEDRSRLFNEIVASGTQRDWEETLINQKGEKEFHLRKLFPVMDAHNNLEMVIGYGINISDRKAFEEQLKHSEARFKSIFDYSLALICIHDLNGIIMDANNTAVSVLGFPIHNLIGSSISDLLPPDKKYEFDRVYLKDIKETGKSEGIMVALAKNNRKVYLLYQNYLVTNNVDEPYVIAFSQDITARINAEKELKKSEEKYRNIIANMNLGLLEVNPDEHIIYANPSFCEMSGYEVDELIGNNAAALFMQDTKHEKNIEVNRKRKENISDAYEIQVRNKRGEVKWWLISGAPVFDINGDFKGSIGIHLDITPQKLLEIELRKAKSDAEHSTKAKEIFLANMSHEIRTPMNAVLGIGRLLAKTTLAQQQRFYLETIQNAANNLLVIINDLLDFSKIEAGKITLEYIGFKLENVLSNAIYVLKHKAEEKGLSLNFDFESGINSILIGDPYRLNQIFINLLSNAIKFTEQGNILLQCTLLKDNTNFQQIKFAVTDTGIGMSREFLTHLFEKFRQEDESITRKFGGTGLGMTISKQMIELMGGEIAVNSRKNIGTQISFIITFPKGTAQDLPAAKETSVDTMILKGKKILLVEDNDMNRLLASTVLSQYGADVVEAEDGSIAIDRFNQSKFDLILMDLQMPVKDGLETTKFIRENLDPNIPIIALTANAFKKEEERCLKAGMNDFITKPFDEEILVNTAAIWLGRKLDVSEIQTASGTANAKLYDLNKLKSISRGDDDFLNRMLDLFLSEIPNSLGQIESAIANNDLNGIAAIAHRIKPALMNMGIGSINPNILFLESLKDNPANNELISQNFNQVTAVLNEVLSQIKVLRTNTTSHL